MNPTTFDVKKAIMICLNKNLAMFVLGLYIYAGEDIPNESDQDREVEKVKLITLDQLKTKASEKGVTDAQMLARLNKNTPEKEHITNIEKLTQAQINGLYKLLNM